VRSLQQLPDLLHRVRLDLGVPDSDGLDQSGDVLANDPPATRHGNWKTRRRRGLPWESTITATDFLAWTIDIWYIRPEHARRVGHPAPFPVELPRRLIELYSYRHDVVLDCFAGAGTTAVAAVTTGRRYIAYDTEPAYLQLARRRITQAHAAAAQLHLDISVTWRQISDRR